MEEQRGTQGRWSRLRQRTAVQRRPQRPKSVTGRALAFTAAGVILAEAIRGQALVSAGGGRRLSGATRRQDLLGVEGGIAHMGELTGRVLDGAGGVITLTSATAS